MKKEQDADEEKKKKKWALQVFRLWAHEKLSKNAMGAYAIHSLFIFTTLNKLMALTAFMVCPYNKRSEHSHLRIIWLIYELESPKSH